MESENITISFYENSIPLFAESAMERLYENIYSSLAHYRIYGFIDSSTSTYVVRKDGKIISVLLLECEKNKVRVLNESIKISKEEIDRFVDYIFASRPSINVILFHAVQIGRHRFSYPSQQCNVLEDIVLTLPETADEYMANLGKATRKTIKYRMSKLTRSFPSLHIASYAREKISAQHVRDIIALQRTRMAAKNRISALSDEESERIIELVGLRGLVSIITIDGRICAGAICCRVGANYFANVLAHDPEYNDYRLGTLCSYLTICNCIEQGGKEFHFLWGQDEYKFLLLGVQKNLDDLAIYRSHFDLLFNGDTALQIAFNGYVRKAKMWLRYQARQQETPSLTSWFAFHSLNFLRSFKQFTNGLLARQR